jgi:16S rRNA (cytosine967-C5)-methyltransferase
VIAPARTSAFHALRALASGSADLPVALARTRMHLTDERDRSLSAEIVTGTVRWQRSLNHLISHFARRPLNKVDPDVLTILRLSVYQLLHLDRVPASAVVDDAVDLARAAHKPSAAGFVNAVLRSLLRQKHRLPLPERPAFAPQNISSSGAAGAAFAPQNISSSGAASPETPADRDAAIAYLGITHSHPDWLVQRWLDRHGFDATERWVRFDN